MNTHHELQVHLSWRSCLAASLVILALGCGDDSSDGADTEGAEPTTTAETEQTSAQTSTPTETGGVDETGGPTDTDDGPSTDTDGPPTEAAGYAFAAQVFAGDEPVSYLVATDALTGEVGLDSGLEIPGRALAAGVGYGMVFVGTNLSGTLTRYQADDSLSFTETGTVSFLNEGTTAFGEYQTQFLFASATKAYYLDGGTARAVIWNPTDMTVQGSVEMPGASLADSLLTFTSTQTFSVDGSFYVPMGWRSNDNVTVRPQAGMLVLDSATDTASVVTDDRGGYVRDGVLAEDGYIYVATEGYGAAVHRIAEDNAPPPCLLRFDPAAGEYDPSFYVELGGLVDGAIAGSLTQAEDGTAFIRVLDESLTDIAPDTNARVLASAPAWRWYSIALGDSPTASLVDDMPAQGSSVIGTRLGGRRFFPEFAGDFSQTDYYEILAAGGGDAAFTVDGLIFSAVEL